MLPSMPILFARESQDAFGNKIEPSTSFFHQHSFQKPDLKPEPPPLAAPAETPKVTAKESKGKGGAKKKDEGTVSPNSHANALETAFVRSYYTKIQSRFSAHSHLPSNKFVQFQSVLKSFDPSKETPVDLYRKIDQLFGEDHKDIVEEFLLFLKPGQSAEAGRFMDHFMLVQITGFIEMLQTTFARKPTVLRKILRALTTGINSGSSAALKTRVLPHLRSNPRLAQVFQALFPDERPPDSAYEPGTDVIDEAFLTADRGYDVWEYEEPAENTKKLQAKESLDTMYLNGRVFLQHGRMLRSARVTYPYSKEPYRAHARRLAPPHCHLSPPPSDEERSSPKQKSKTNIKLPPKRSKKQLKSPTKKDVNDNTNKDCAINSPKVKKQSAKTKVSVKAAKKEGKVHACKKDDVPKAKPVKTEPPEAKKVAVKSNWTQDEAKKVTFKSNWTQDEAKKVTFKSNWTQDEAKKVTFKSNWTQDETKKATFKSNWTQDEAKKMEVKSNWTQDEVKKAEAKSDWTRDEDKTMLQVLKGDSGSEEIFGKIRELLPHRSATEIKERFCHVMTLLQQMAVGEVT